MKLHVVAVGRVRNPDLRAACDQYAARTARYTQLEIHEVPEGGRGRQPPEAVQRREADALLRAIPSGARTVAVTRKGSMPTSREFARQIDRWRQDARPVAFVVGGAYGLGSSVLDRCEEMLSLSHLTLPHELARLVLLEQLYRGNTLLRGEPYHKSD